MAIATIRENRRLTRVKPHWLFNLLTTNDGAFIYDAPSFLEKFMRLLKLSVTLVLLIPAFAFAQTSATAQVPSTAAKPAIAASTGVAPGTAMPAVAAKPQVKLVTTMGEIVIELESERAPKSVANFLSYVQSGQYDGTLFHRVIPGFMVQGGGYTKDLTYKGTRDPIENEATNGLSNLRGTVAMARLDDPNSATSQFFINVVDNKFLNFTLGGSAGYAVFARVTSGMDVVDKIRMVKTDSATPTFADKPLEPVLIQTATVLEVKAPDVVPVAVPAVAPAK
jgi:peptidyl-prolyl cis-trans isomerase A (cyclophilin A)